MDINYKYNNKQNFINQLIEQTKFNIARLTNLENIVNEYILSTNDITKVLNNIINSKMLFADNQPTTNITEGLINSSLQWNKINFNNVLNISHMLTAQELTNLNLNNTTFNLVTNGVYCFHKMENLISLRIPLTTFNLLTNGRNMFSFCNNLTTLDISNAIFNNLYNGNYMFGNLNNLTKIYLPKATFNNLYISNYMFAENNKLETIFIPKATFNNLSNTSSDTQAMFYNCPSLKEIFITEQGFNNLKNRNCFGDNNDKWIYDTDKAILTQ